ncbi:MAG TPA: alpha/beta fold hydrolase [Dermatophilaceae bacterium]|nr:alpha/beta fold hydrolase [Dermatophilaceae bacterium]
MPVRAARALRRVLATLAAVVVLGATPPASPATATARTPLVAAPAAYDIGTEAVRVPVGPEPDGSAVTLDAMLYLPRPAAAPPGSAVGPAAPAAPRPAVLLAHGFGGSRADLDGRARELAAAGYVVLGYTARGFGLSGGRIHLDDPDFEIADARALVDLLARRPEVARTDAGDPRVGVLGISYGGALALMLGATDPRIDTVVAGLTWHDLAEAFFPNRADVPPDSPGPFKALWASRFLGGTALPGLTGATGVPGSSTPSATPRQTDVTAPEPPSRQAGPGALCGRFDRTVCRLFLAAAETGTPSPELLTLLRAHSPRPLLPGLRAPTLLVQGMTDTLFGIEHAESTSASLASRGVPVARRWIDGGHDGASSTAELDTAAIDRWLAEHLPVDGSAPATGLGSTPEFAYAAPLPRRQTVAPLYAASPAPPSVVRAPFATSAALPLLTPPGGQPASVTAVGLPGSGGGAAYQLAALPGQSVALDTVPFTERVEVVGPPRISLTVTSSAEQVTLFVSLWQATEGTQPTLPRRLVAPVRVAVQPGVPTQVDMALAPGTWTFESGSRARVLITSTDILYAAPRTARLDQIEPAGPLVLPVVASTRISGASDLDTESIGVASAIAVLLLLVTGWALWRRRRQRRLPTRPDLADIPLVVDGLVKTYADGHRAVDDVSWRAERGQVVGLLGPNGAGKTTTLRMVMGLIAPDAGAAYLAGRPVHPGADALADVGALIEGPGFLPHLTGLENLRAYWAATGRDEADAHLAEALDVAALGGAIDRPVRSYSHGMKQRLGIAQAMLGLPDLLVLDEPTNGLDPPQIAAMRPILQRYAAAGRTVVVSSHLLAEVEQTCSHVVVMHAGRVVTTGRVADLVDSSDTTVVELAPTTAVAEVTTVAERLRSVPGILDVEVVDDEADPRLVVTAGMPRADVVRALTEVGADIVGVSSRKHLEEVFLGVIADASAGRESSNDGAQEGDSVTERLRQVRAR